MLSITFQWNKRQHLSHPRSSGLSPIEVFYCFVRSQCEIVTSFKMQTLIGRRMCFVRSMVLFFVCSVFKLNWSMNKQTKKKQVNDDNNPHRYGFSMKTLETQEFCCRFSLTAFPSNIQSVIEIYSFIKYSTSKYAWIVIDRSLLCYLMGKCLP